jgi:hypothetical protein
MDSVPAILSERGPSIRLAVACVAGDEAMKQLVAVLMVLSVMCLLSAVSGAGFIPSLAIISGSEIAGMHANGLDRCMTLTIATFFAAWSYAIYARLLIGWKAGWLAILLSYVYFLVEAISATRRNAIADSFSELYLPSTLVVISGAVVVFYWSRIWYRHKAYFNATISPK